MSDRGRHRKQHHPNRGALRTSRKGAKDGSSTSRPYCSPVSSRSTFAPPPDSRRPTVTADTAVAARGRRETRPRFRSPVCSTMLHGGRHDYATDGGDDHKGCCRQGRQGRRSRPQPRGSGGQGQQQGCGIKGGHSRCAAAVKLYGQRHKRRARRPGARKTHQRRTGEGAEGVTPRPRPAGFTHTVHRGRQRVIRWHRTVVVAQISSFASQSRSVPKKPSAGDTWRHAVSAQRRTVHGKRRIVQRKCGNYTAVTGINGWRDAHVVCRSGTSI